MPAVWLGFCILVQFIVFAQPQKASGHRKSCQYGWNACKIDQYIVKSLFQYSVWVEFSQMGVVAQSHLAVPTSEEVECGGSFFDSWH